MITELQTQPKYKLEGYFEDLTKINKSIASGELDFALCLINIQEREGVTSPEILWNKIKIFKKKGFVEEAKKTFENIISIHSEDQYFQFAYANYLYDLGDFQKSLEKFSLLLLSAEMPRMMTFLALRTCGSIQTNLKDFDSAEEYFNKAYGIYTNCSILSLNYGLLELRKQNYENAKMRFVHAVSVDNSNDLAWLGLAYCYQFFGETELQVGCLLRALDSNPKNQLVLEELKKTKTKFDEING